MSARIAKVLAFTSMAISSAHSQERTGPVTASPLLAIDSMIAATFAKDSLGGVSVAVLQNGKMSWTKSYGYADRERGIRASDSTVYRIASVTKQFTGLMLLQLAERRTVRLSDPVSRFLPEIKRIKHLAPEGSPVTLVQLATMTSGLAGEPREPGRYNVGPPAVWQQQLLASLAETPMLWEPGSRANYSNSSYAILAAALSRAARAPYVSYIETSFLRPLGLHETTFAPTGALSARLAKGYHRNSDGSLDTLTALRDHLGRGKNLPAGGLYSTVRDLARFVAFQLGSGPESVLHRATLDSALAGLVAADADLNYGDGVFFSAMRQFPSSFVALGHRGVLTGYQASVAFRPQSRAGVVILANATDETGEFRYQVMAEQILEFIVTGRRPSP